MNSLGLRSKLGNVKGPLSLFGVVLLLGCLISAQLYIKSQGPNYIGILLVLKHLLDLSLVLTLFAISASTGMFVLARAGFAFEQPLDTLLFSAAIGVGLLSTFILMLGLLSGLQVMTLGWLLLVCAILVYKQLRELPRLVVGSASHLRANSSIPILFVLGAVTFFMISQALTPPLDWDSLLAHLRVPAQFLQKGQIYLPEGNLQTAAFVQLVHMLYIPLLAFGSLAGPALVSTFFALMLGLAVFRFSLQFFGNSTANRSLVLLWASPMLVLVAITPRLDVTLSYYLFLAHYALLKALSDSSCRRFFFLSAVLLGLAIGTKYHALAYGLALSPLIFCASRSRSQGLAVTIRSLIFFGLLVFVVALPWLAKNWLLYRAPFYPFFTERRVDPWLAPFYGSEPIPSLDVYPQLRVPFNLVDLLIAPARLTVEGEAVLYFMNPIFLILPLWLFFFRNKKLNWLIFPAICYVMIVIFPYPRTNLRYLMAALPPLTIAATYIAESVGRRFFSTKGVNLAFAPLTLIALLPSAAMMYLWSQTVVWKYLTGTASFNDYLRTERSAYMEIVTYVNEQLPLESKILMLFEARGYYFKAPVIQDDLLDNWPLLALRGSTLNCLRSTAISHVLFNTGAVTYFIRRGLNPQTLQLESFQQFADQCLIPLYQGEAYMLYRVRQ